MLQSVVVMTFLVANLLQIFRSCNSGPPVLITKLKVKKSSIGGLFEAFWSQLPKMKRASSNTATLCTGSKKHNLLLKIASALWKMERYYIFLYWPLIQVHFVISKLFKNLLFFRFHFLGNLFCKNYLFLHTVSVVPHLLQASTNVHTVLH